MQSPSLRGSPPAAPPPSPPPRRRAAAGYWLCQAAGWLGYLLLYYPVSLSQRRPAWTYLGLFLTYGVEGVMLTHLYRGFLRRRGWLGLPLRAVLPRALAANVLLAAAQVGFVFFNVALAIRGLPEAWRPAALPFTPAFLLGQFADNSFVFGMWSALYFGVHLFDRQRRAEVEQWRLAAALAEAELRGLRAQVNPHFLFNALNGLRGLIAEDPARAQDAVTQLAAILRHALQSGGSATVPFHAELKVVEDYLALELIRFGDRLTVQREIDPAVLGLPVPPMLVQTLAENAIKHGVSRQRGPSGITLRAVRDEAAGRWSVEVANPGQLDGHGGSGGDRDGGGLGLANARQRLRHLFGEAACLELREAPPGRVTASLRLPLPGTPAAPEQTSESTISP